MRRSTEKNKSGGECNILYKEKHDNSILLSKKLVFCQICAQARYVKGLTHIRPGFFTSYIAFHLSNKAQIKTYSPFDNFAVLSRYLWISRHVLLKPLTYIRLGFVSHTYTAESRYGKHVAQVVTRKSMINFLI